MKKKWIALFTGTLLAGALVLPLTACGGGDTPKGNDANVTVSASGAKVVWDKVDGARAYEIYHSSSRFGEYEYVNTQTAREYSNADKYGYYRINALDKNGEVISSKTYSYDLDTFGENTHIYAPTDDSALVQDDIDAFRESTSQFGKGRFAALFKSGEDGIGNYNGLDLAMRYYMTFAGLGTLPTDVELGG
ncbi:MAG: hypothetical protein K2K12_02810, partial [Clostridia bacterium]|nr:hypothetical protein [Clostridia bacterium]